MSVKTIIDLEQEIREQEPGWGPSSNVKVFNAERSQLNQPSGDAKKLDIFYASEIDNNYDPPDELIEDIFICGEGSVIYGASNTGKTFLALDFCASVVLGRPWMGKQIESGAVLYLAAESPQSIYRRLQAYQKYHDVKLPHFGVIRNPLNLFDGNEDTNLIIDAVKQHEDRWGVPVRFIVGDTLSRLSAGANENAGQDMSIVVKHFDQIRTETSSHFTLIHHSGKNAAYGARGWSGVRAAIDTEIEVVSENGLCAAEITKQRELASKGEKFYFKLEPVIMGKSKWGKDVGSCVVVGAGGVEIENKHDKKKLSDNEYLFWERLGPLLKDSHHFGKGDAPPMKPCVLFDDAVSFLTPYYPGSVDPSRKRDSTVRMLRSMVGKKWLGFKDGWLWDAPFSHG